jgi:glycosyltransferase involved in cell wall biosynthesis
MRPENSIYFVQDSEEVFFKKNTFWGKLLRILVFYGYRNSSLNFIVTTEYGERKLRVITRSKQPRINKLILGVDKKIFYYDPTVKKKNVILFFPRKGWFKDFNLLKSTFEILYNNPDIIDYQFWFVSQELELFKSIDHFDRVKFFSIKSDVELREVYNSCDLLIHTSKYEGICLPILEALSCGTYVIATNSFGPLTYLNRNNSLVSNFRDASIIAKMAFDYLKNDRVSEFQISNSVLNLSVDLFISDFSDVIKESLQ